MTVYSRRGLQGRLVSDLGRRILAGEIAEHEVIDVEALEREYQVSRTVVREAVKVLTAKGLLDARPRTGTYVLPRSSWRLLDSDVMGWRADAGLSDDFLAELDELRHIIEPAAARLAAERRTDADVDALNAAVDDMEAAFLSHRSDGTVDTPDRHIEADIAFHTALLAATHNELVAHMDMLLQPILDLRDSLIPAGEQDERFIPAHRAVAKAVAAQRPQRAHKAMVDLLDAAAADLRELLSRRAVQ